MLVGAPSYEQDQPGLRTTEDHTGEPPQPADTNDQNSIPVARIFNPESILHQVKIQEKVLDIDTAILQIKEVLRMYLYPQHPAWKEIGREYNPLNKFLEEFVKEALRQLEGRNDLRHDIELVRTFVKETLAPLFNLENSPEPIKAAYIAYPHDFDVHFFSNLLIATADNFPNALEISHHKLQQPQKALGRLVVPHPAHHHAVLVPAPIGIGAPVAAQVSKKYYFYKKYNLRLPIAFDFDTGFSNITQLIEAEIASCEQPWKIGLGGYVKGLKVQLQKLKNNEKGLNKKFDDLKSYVQRLLTPEIQSRGIISRQLVDSIALQATIWPNEYVSVAHREMVEEQIVRLKKAQLDRTAMIRKALADEIAGIKNAYRLIQVNSLSILDTRYKQLQAEKDDQVIELNRQIALLETNLGMIQQNPESFPLYQLPQASPAYPAQVVIHGQALLQQAQGHGELEDDITLAKFFNPEPILPQIKIQEKTFNIETALFQIIEILRMHLHSHHAAWKETGRVFDPLNIFREQIIKDALRNLHTEKKYLKAFELLRTYVKSTLAPRFTVDNSPKPIKAAHIADPHSFDVNYLPNLLIATANRFPSKIELECHYFQEQQRAQGQVIDNALQASQPVLAPIAAPTALALRKSVKTDFHFHRTNLNLPIALDFDTAFSNIEKIMKAEIAFCQEPGRQRHNYVVMLNEALHGLHDYRFGFNQKLAKLQSFILEYTIPYLSTECQDEPRETIMFQMKLWPFDLVCESHSEHITDLEQHLSLLTKLHVDEIAALQKAQLDEIATIKKESRISQTNSLFALNIRHKQQLAEKDHHIHALTRQLAQLDHNLALAQHRLEPQQSQQVAKELPAQKEGELGVQSCQGLHHGLSQSNLEKQARETLEREKHRLQHELHTLNEKLNNLSVQNQASAAAPLSSSSSASCAAFTPQHLLQRQQLNQHANKAQSTQHHHRRRSSIEITV